MYTGPVFVQMQEHIMNGTVITDKSLPLILKAETDTSHCRERLYKLSLDHRNTSHNWQVTLKAANTHIAQSNGLILSEDSWSVHFLLHCTYLLIPHISQDENSSNNNKPAWKREKTK